MKSKKHNPKGREPWFHITPEMEDFFKKRGEGARIRNLKRLVSGKPTPTSHKMDQLLPSTTKMCEVFGSISPKLDRECIGSVVAAYWDVVYYAVRLSEELHKLVRIKGRWRRSDLKLLLEVIQETAIDGERRQVNRLRRDIPKLLKQLTPVPRKRSVRTLQKG